MMDLKIPFNQMIRSQSPFECAIKAIQNTARHLFLWKIDDLVIIWPLGAGNILVRFSLLKSSQVFTTRGKSF